MSEAGLSAEMLLQVHDELIFEVDEEDAALAANLIKVVMESAASPAIELSVPLVVEAGIASNWALAH